MSNSESTPREPAALQGLFHAHRRFWIGFMVVILSLYMIVATLPAPGVSWDESIYFGQAITLLNWHRSPDTSLSPESIREHWQQPIRTNAGVIYAPREAHPPLGKAMIAASVWLLSDIESAEGGRVEPLIAARMASAVCFAFVCLLLYLLVERTFDPLAGVLAVGALLFMPRIFGHAHFATLEMPLLAMWMLTVYAFEKGTRNAVWSVAAGIAFGLALLVRFNAVFIPVIFFPWAILVCRWRTIQNALALAIISPLVFLAGWPAMWVNTSQTLRLYLADKLSRGEDPIPFAYFGQNHPGADYAIVMTIITVPIPLLVAAIIGGVQAFRNGEGKPAEDASSAAPAPTKRGIAWLLAFGCLGPILLMMLPGVPHYDGVRLYMATFPFLAGFAGIGAAMLWERHIHERRRAVMGVAAAVLLVLVLPLVLIYPFHLAYYNLLVGGPWGAHSLGMETVYWNESFDDNVLDALGEALPQGGRVALEGIGSQVDDVLRATGRWPAGVEVVDFETQQWDVLIVVPRKGWLEERRPAVVDYMLDSAHTPVREWRLSPFGSVPVCRMYRRAGA